MKAVFFALGSRGDIEPLFSLGEVLRKKNWEVVYVFPEQFRSLVEQEGAAFRGFTKKLNEKNFELPLRELIYKPKFKKNAEDMAKEMSKEFKVKDLMSLI